MNLDMLRLFCDVVRSQSFSRGAAMNDVSQSAASQAVLQLERLLGVRLVDRSKRPFVVTPAGQACYEESRDILERFDSLQARVQALTHEVSGLVRVAAIYSVGLHHLSQCMQDFMRQFPKAKVRLEYLRPNKVYEAVLADEADLGLISYPTAQRGLAVIPLRSETMILVCHPGHRLARMPHVTIEELRGEKYVGFDRDLAIRKALDRFFREQDVSVEMVMEFDNIETIKQAIEVGAGLSILPEPTVRQEVLNRTLAAVPLANHTLTRPIGIIHRQRKLFTPAMAKFAELLQASHDQAG